MTCRVWVRPHSTEKAGLVVRDKQNSKFENQLVPGPLFFPHFRAGSGFGVRTSEKHFIEQSPTAYLLNQIDRLVPAMEGSESEAVFDSYNLNPQLFINEVLNSIDDMVDGAFEFYKQQASVIVGGDACADRSQELLQGVSSLRYMIQAVLDKRMGMWEKYCLRHCFVVPEGFSLPKDESSRNGLLLQDELCDAELDTQLATLREKLVAAGQESAELHREIQALEKQSVLRSSYDASVAEALNPLEENSMQDLFQEIEKTASILHLKMRALKTKREDMERVSFGRVECGQGLSAKLEDLQNAVDILKNM